MGANVRHGNIGRDLVYLTINRRPPFVRRSDTPDTSSTPAPRSCTSRISISCRQRDATRRRWAALNRAAVDLVSLTINYDDALHFERTGDFDAAISRVKKALDLDPNSGFVHHVLGELYADRRMYDEARVELRRALQLSPETAHFIAALAFVEARSGRRDAALDGLRALNALAGKKYVSRHEFALVYANGSRRDWKAAASRPVRMRGIRSRHNGPAPRTARC